MKRTLILFLMLSLQVRAIVPQSVSVVCSNDPALSGIYSHSMGSIWQSSTNTLWKETEEENTPWYISGGGKTYTAPDNGLDVPPLVFSKVGYVPPSMTVSGTGTEADDEYVLMDQYGEKRDWYSYNADATIAWWYDGWWYISVYREGGDTWTNPGTGELPDKTGWSIGSIYGSPAPTLAYDSAIATVSYTFAEYVNATRTDLNLAVPQAMLPWNTYTNLLASTNSVWLTGQGTSTSEWNFVGTNPHAAIVGSPCLTFGGDDYLRFLKAGYTTVPVEMSAWFSSTNSVGQSVIGFFNQPSSTDYLAIKLNIDGTVSLVYRNSSGSTYATSGDTYNDGVPHFARAELRSKTDRRLYIDGSRVASTTNLLGGAGYIQYSSISCGRLDDSTPSEPFYGQIWDVRVSFDGSYAYPLLFDWTPSHDLGLERSLKKTWSSTLAVSDCRINSTNVYAVPSVYSNINEAITQINTDGVPDALITVAAGVYVDGWGDIDTLADLEVVGSGTVIIEPSSGYGAYIDQGDFLYVENITFDGSNGSTCFISENPTAGSRMYFKDCVFQNSASHNGFWCGGTEEVYLQDCSALSNHNDGFGYGSIGGVSTKAVELRCVASNNGAEQGPYDGSTCHELCRTIRINCIYDSNIRSVYDVHSTQNILYGCTLTNPRGIGGEYSVGLGVGYDTGARTALTYAFDCNISGATYNTKVQDNSKLYVTDLISPALVEAGSSQSVFECNYFQLPFAESSGTILYDVSGNGNHGTLTTTNSAACWANTQNVSAYLHNYGGVTWSSGTTNVYVPNTLAGVPATNNVAGFTVVRTNLTGMVHNRGPYSLLFGGVTNTYSMLTNSVSITTNATGQITEYAK